MLIRTKHTYAHGAESHALFWFRFGQTHYGITVPRFLQFRGPYGKAPLWDLVLKTFLPIFRIDIWAHTGQCDIRWFFRVTVLGFSIGYKLRGEAVDSSWWRYSETGLRIGARWGWKRRDWGLRSRFAH